MGYNPVQLGQQPNSGSTSVVLSSDEVSPSGFLKVTDEPTQLFYDPFDSVLDVGTIWSSANGNSGVAAAVTFGFLSLGTGTVANGYSKLTSVPSFKLPTPAWLGFSSVIALPDGAAPTANSFRFWGSGTAPATPSTTTPVTDGIGFEITTAGKMIAVVYSGGTRTAVQDLSSSGNNKQPLNATSHRYIVYVRSDKIFWFIDGLDTTNLVATANFTYTIVQTLPSLFVAVGGPTPPVSNTQIQCYGTAVWDTGKNNFQISDGTYPWRKATVNASNQMSVSVDNIGGLPVTMSRGTFSGTITTQNLNLNSGVATAGSTVAFSSLASNNYSTAAIQVTGTWTGTLSVQATLDNNNWVTLTKSLLNVATNTYVDNISSASVGIWRLEVGAYGAFRVTASAAMTGTASVSTASTTGGGITKIDNDTRTQPIVGVQDARITGSITGGTQSLAAVTATNRNLATIDISGTYAGLTFVIEGSTDGGTNYNPLQSINNATGVASSGTGTWTPGTNATASYDVAIGAMTHIRVRSTALASGTAAIGTSLQTFAYDPVVASIDQGPAAAGSALAGNPVRIGGSDGVNVQNVAVTAKATQGAFGLATQDLKDAGRTSVMVTASVASTATAETLITITKSVGLAATSTASSNTITSGKRFRIQSLVASARNSTGTVTSNVTLRLRAAVGGATTTASPLQITSTVNLPASAASTLFPPILIPDGFEIDSNGATNTWGLTITHPQWVTGTQVATFDITMIGYEY
jgi:hypothetical protein